MLAGIAACGGAEDSQGEPGQSAISGATETPAIALWEQETPAFGIFVPSERAPGSTDENGNRLPPLYTADGARALAEDPLLDYLFLNLEGSYDADAVRAMVAGLDAADVETAPTLLVRIPTIEAAGEEATRAHVAEVLALGADGVVIPHVRSAEEARLAVGFFEEVGADVWSPANPDGTIIAMLMVEDVGAIETVEEIVAVPGYSMLSCGIGSLTRAMGGDREGAEAACQNVRDLAAMHGMPSMMTADANSIGARIEQGYLGLLLSGSAEQAGEVIREGREIAGRGGM
jgi:2-keto-3-deoxy-L-rhamnonate aldolase RhmA